MPPQGADVLLQKTGDARANGRSSRRDRSFEQIGDPFVIERRIALLVRLRHRAYAPRRQEYRERRQLGVLSLDGFEVPPELPCALRAEYLVFYQADESIRLAGDEDVYVAPLPRNLDVRQRPAVNVERSGRWNSARPRLFRRLRQERAQEVVAEAVRSGGVKQPSDDPRVLKFPVPNAEHVEQVEFGELVLQPFQVAVKHQRFERFLRRGFLRLTCGRHVPSLRFRAIRWDALSYSIIRFTRRRPSAAAPAKPP